MNRKASMNEIKSFTFYRNYYEIIRYLPNEQKTELYDAILEYMFEDKEPILDGLLRGIWINLKMPLDTSRNCIEKGKKGGAPKGNSNAKKTTQKQPKNNLKTTQKQANNNFLFLISNFFISNFIFLNNKDKDILENKIIEWLQYKAERKETYKETGFKKLLARIESATSQYGVEEIVSLIDECMANNYKGIIFEKLKEKKPIVPTPGWFDKEIKEERTEWTDEQKQGFEEFKKQVQSL